MHKNSAWGGGTRVLDKSENALSLIPSDFDADLDQQNKPDSSASNPTSNLDLGFRVFKVDSSNFLPNRLPVDEYSQDGLIQAELNIKEEREPLDLLFECVLSWHLPLNCPFKVVTIAGHKAFDYNFGDLLACFEENVGEDFVLALSKLEDKPLRVVMADSCFSTSASKINLSELFKMLLPEVELRVI